MHWRRKARLWLPRLSSSLVNGRGRRACLRTLRVAFGNVPSEAAVGPALCSGYFGLWPQSLRCMLSQCSSCGLRSDFGTGSVDEASTGRTSARTVCRRGYGSERVCIRNRTGMHTESKWYAYRIRRVCIPDCSGMHVETDEHACRFRYRFAAVSLRRVRHSDELRNENEITPWFDQFP